MNLVNVVLIDNHLHHCTIVNRDFVIRLRNENEGVWPRLSYENCIVHSWFVWMLWTREEVSLNDSAGIRDSWTRTRDGGRKWVWTTRLAFAICERERGAEGGSESEWLTEWFTATGNTTERTNEQTNERTNDSFWWTERRELIRGKESWNPPLLDYECDARLRHPCSLFNTQSGQQWQAESGAKCGYTFQKLTQPALAAIQVILIWILCKSSFISIQLKMSN